MEKSIQAIVPRLLVKHQLPHPEPYGEILVELLNGMVIDVYTDEETGLLFSITNDEDLIEYLSNNKIDEPFIEVNNGELVFRTVLHNDKEMVFNWFNSNLINEYKYEIHNIIEFISHTISSTSHQFIISYKEEYVGMFGYSITGDETNFNYDIYQEELSEDIVDYIFDNAISYIKNNSSANKIILIVLADKLNKLGLCLNNGFEISYNIYLPVSESGYKKAYVLVLIPTKQ